MWFKCRKGYWEHSCWRSIYKCHTRLFVPPKINKVEKKTLLIPSPPYIHLGYTARAIWHEYWPIHLAMTKRSIEIFSMWKISITSFGQSVGFETCVRFQESTQTCAHTRQYISMNGHRFSSYILHQSSSLECIAGRLQQHVHTHPEPRCAHQSE